MEMIMQQSESINELAAALCEAQDELENVTKSKQGHGYKYAELSQLLELKPVLKKYGLSVIQIDGNVEGKAAVHTRLMHTSGQWIGGVLSCEIQANQRLAPVQALGSCLTYLRRYSLAAILMITQVDDDGILKITREQLGELYTLFMDLSITNDRIQKALTHYKAPAVLDLSVQQADDFIAKLHTEKNKKVPHEHV
jgi:hypothetical protein